MPELNVPELTVVQGALDSITHVPRGVTVVAGLLVMLRGAKLYPLVIVAPGLALGVAAGLALPLEPTTRALAAVALAAVGALLCRFVERAAIWAIGAVLAGTLVMWGWPLFRPDPAPTWLPAVGAVAGLLLFPALFRAALRPVTAALGATMVLWSLGQQDRPLLFVGLAVVGWIVQAAGDRKRDDDAQ